MATVSITVPDALVPRLAAALRSFSPQYAALTDAAAFRAATADHWRQVLAQVEEAVAVASAASTLSTVGLDARTKAIADSAGIG